jgi:predicted RNA-binding protein YlxR (DUF448 family)
VTIDPSGRRNGRGAYLCAAGPCRQDQKTNGALARALHAQLPPELLTALAADPGPTTIEGDARGQE